MATYYTNRYILKSTLLLYKYELPIHIIQTFYVFKIDNF